MMKASRYNHIIWRRNLPQLLYNSWHHRFLELDNAQSAVYGGLSLPLTYNLINQKDPSVAKLVADLDKMEFLIDDNRDELKQIEVLSHLHRFDRSRLELWINPTTRCDQNCPGCPYQDSRSDLTAPALEKIFRLISGRTPGLKQLRINWWGGQPALAWKMVLDFDKKLAELARQFGFEYSYRTISSGGGPANRLTALSRENELYLNIESVDLNNLPAAPVVLLGDIAGILKKIDKLPPRSRIRFIKNIPGGKLCRNVNHLCHSAPNLEDEEVGDINRLLEAGFTVENLPRPKLVSCQATDPQSFIIDAAGNSYRCWDDLGGPKKMLPEDTDDPMAPQNFRWLDWDPYHEAHCRMCNILPWCLGGCRARPPDADCSQWHYALREMLSLAAAAKKKGA
ncbi:MAG: SPASM domain-containing protein [Candidatus Edwardsbacteria bacterium]|nr:SPASM domain-containing protein [Candidatus Edwardsbacteria bacterium]MBU1577410.1 SPASM domain-containing protein [Candidatus Edwardsbacteria bacterium]MBU2462788.1 SPASM domain-containing protein [Candidatus Edwardsbacteria bacterium]